MYQLNDILILKKAHPCGGNRWEVVRIGADIKLRCLTCGRFLSCTRDELKKRVKTIQSQEAEHGRN